MNNTLRTAMLLGLLTGLLILIGGYLGGQQGMVIAFVVAGLMNFASYWFSDKIVLMMYRAKQLEPRDHPTLFSTVERLTRKAGLPMPRVYLIPSEGANAFATGRDPQHAAVAVTEGILELLSPDELEGVLAHELSHVKNRDILISSIAATIAGAIMMLANMARWAALFGGLGRRDGEERGGEGLLGFIFLAFLAPIAAMLIQLAVSRAREYQADAGGARMAGTPLGLAAALEKLHRVSERQPLEAGPATAHLFIVNPLSGRTLMTLFSTHPPVEERVARLRGMLGRM